MQRKRSRLASLGGAGNNPIAQEMADRTLKEKKKKERKKRKESIHLPLSPLNFFRSGL